MKGPFAKKIGRRSLLTKLPLLAPAIGCGRMMLFAAEAEKQDNSSLTIGPVLQSAQENSIRVMFETYGDALDVAVEYGATTALGSVAPVQERIKQGYSFVEEPRTICHATIDGLEPDTKYYYRIKSQGIAGPTFEFRTPPKRGEIKPFRFAVYSDCQQRPEVHRRLVTEGILGSRPAGTNIADDLGFVLIAGDVVEDGDVLDEYKERLFDPCEGFSASVPLYTTIGNHEENSAYYWNYLNLPMSRPPMAPPAERHWYSFDYGNVHVIALDSNSAFKLQEQLDWLAQDLEAAANDPRTHMIFCMFHHPFKSELWPHGEEEYSGKIIEHLEIALARSGKPGAFFHGHTHGYSRGQSRDAPLYWVNVGSAGGTLDRWGDYTDQRTYPEFQRTIDEYGLVMLSVNAGGKPGFTATRLGFGNEDAVKSCEEQDVFGAGPGGTAPAKPVLEAMSTADGKIHLEASPYVGEVQHLEAEWQLAATADFASPLASAWVRREKLYAKKDLMAGVDLTKATLDAPKDAPRLYARVRYRCERLLWSPWSEGISGNS